MKWSEHAWKEAEPLYAEILKLPFIQELVSGTLSRERFFYYLEQDALYLREYGKAMQAAADRFHDEESRDLFLRFSSENLEAEHSLHHRYLGTIDHNAEPSPACMLSYSHLYLMVMESAPEVAFASVLPCFLVYEKTGMHIRRNCCMDAHPYIDWIETYSEKFSDSTEKLLSLCDRSADKATGEIRNGMTRAFLEGVKMEWYFWKSAYRMETWEI